MPLRIEAFNADLSRWVQFVEVGSNDPPGTISSNLPDGRREIYQFSCSLDDSYSAIKRLAKGIDLEVGRLRITDAASVIQAETVAILRRGDSPYRLTVKTDVSPRGRIIRFTHTASK